MENLKTFKPPRTIASVIRGLLTRQRHRLESAPVTENDRRGPLLDKLPQRGICAEVGVWKGQFSQRILSRLEPRELQLVDPWTFCPQFPDRWYGGAAAKSQEEMDQIFSQVVKRFQAFPQVKVVRSPSVLAAKSFPDNYFDWVYIDGDHSFDDVLSDLRAWAPKIRRGGHLAGDDFNWRDEDMVFSVRNAVLAFANERRLPIAFVEGGQFLLRLHAT